MVGWEGVEFWQERERSSFDYCNVLHNKIYPHLPEKLIAYDTDSELGYQWNHCI
jgi:hypothetical protein